MFPKDFKNYIIKSRKKEIEPHEILLDRLAQEREEQTLEVPLSQSVLAGFFLAILILLLLLFSRTSYFQVFKSKDLAFLAEQNKARTYPQRAARGVIYDRNFEQMVSNQPALDLIADKRDLPWQEKERDMITSEVAKILEQDFQILKSKLEESNLPEVLVSENLEHEKLMVLKTKIASSQLKGFRIEENTVRDYSEEKTLAHVLGFTGKINAEELKNSENYSIADQIGKLGLEKSYESILKGEPGFFRVERDAQGNVISSGLVSEPEPGKSLLLWLDLGLQKKISDELSRVLLASGTKKAVAVALDPQTGGVLALVSLPSFDPNIFSKKISEKEWQELKDNPLEPLFNRAISGIGYPTGSTIKPLIASAALEEGIVEPQKQIYCQGLISIENPYYPQIEPETYEYHDWKIHGWTDLRKAIAESCNVYFYTVGGGYEGFKGLGPEKIIKWLKLFGWGKKTGIDLVAEGQGILPEINKDWRLGDTYHLSIGQGAFSITPLQVAAGFSAIANGGKWYQPQLVKEILEDKTTVQKIEPKIINQDFVNPENLEIVRQGMREAVTYGSAVLLNDLPVKAAAKTGTAQTAKENYYHNWVTVFAPYENPEIVLTIVIEDVWGLQSLTLPVAREVLNWYFQSR